MTTTTDDKTNSASEPAGDTPAEQNRAQVQYSKDGSETWRNSLKGRVVIRRTGFDGRERNDLIRSGASFTLTPDQRRQQQAASANERLDLFKNGALQPVILVEGHDDNDDILANPNHLPEADTASIFRLKGEKFAKRIAVIDNPAALDRLLALAEEPKNGAFVAQLRILERRAGQITQSRNHVRSDVAAGVAQAPPPGAFKPVTPG